MVNFYYIGNCYILFIVGFLRGIEKMNFYSKIIDILYPPRCAYCDKVILPTDSCCDDCKNSIKRDFIMKNIFVKYKAIKCVSIFEYDGIVRESIIKFKFRDRKPYAKQFGIELAELINKYYNYVSFDIMTCIPITFKKRLARGYNQSYEILKETRNLVKIPCKELLYKNRNTLDQHKLSAKARTENVKGAFSVKSSEDVKGKAILLFDDIITTGNTMKEACLTLLNAGAKELYCATLARAEYCYG